jgi:hypothetical protein
MINGSFGQKHSFNARSDEKETLLIASAVCTEKLNLSIPRSGIKGEEGFRQAYFLEPSLS